MDEKYLIKLLDKWEKKRQRAEDNYQNSGIQRYLNDQRNAEDVCMAIQIALRAKPGAEAVATVQALKGVVKHINDLTGDYREKAIKELLWDIEHCTI